MSKKKLAAIIIACTIAIITIVVIVVIATRPPTQFNTYSRFGFSFQYPKNFSITEVEVFGREVNNNLGMVQASVENLETGENEIFQVTWIELQPDYVKDRPGGLEGYLEYNLQYGFAALESSEEVASLDKDEPVESTKAGHLIFYQYFGYNSTEGDEVYGVFSCFYCDESLKSFKLLTMTNIISVEEDCLENFRSYLASFTCHH